MYTLAGTVTSGNVSYQESGTFVADGNGNVTGGEDDFVQNLALLSGAVTGTYDISTDGTGILNLNLPRGPVQFAVALISNSSFYLIEYDSSASGDGEGVQQTAAALSAIPSGTFVFRLRSTLANSPAIVGVSRVGQIIFQNGSIAGIEDAVRAGAPVHSSITGSMSAPDANGRGTAVITDDAGESDYAYYVIDSSTLKFLEIDPGPLGGGRADAQSAATFSNAMLQGGFSFRFRGDTGTQAFGLNGLGAFAADGNGNIVSGSYDAVQDGIPVSNTSLAGNYVVEPSGRATITLNPQGTGPVPLIVWLVSSSYGFLLVNAPDLAADGRLDQQHSSPFSAASLNGPYAFYEFGAQSENSPWLVRVGVMTFDGRGTVTFTNYFVNRSGSTAQNGPLTGDYTVGANGRVVAFAVGSVNTQVIYLISNNSASLVLGSSGSELAGSLAQQAP